MEDEDQSDVPGANERDDEDAKPLVDPDVVDSTNVVPFFPREQPAAGVPVDYDRDDSWPFDDFGVRLGRDDREPTVPRRVELVIPTPAKTGSLVVADTSDTRISLFWRDSHRLDPEGLVLTDADGQVLDLGMFRVVRDQLGAWIECGGQEGEVLAALHSAAYRADEPGIGAPAS